MYQHMCTLMFDNTHSTVLNLAVDVSLGIPMDMWSAEQWKAYREHPKLLAQYTADIKKLLDRKKKPIL